ncbi:MAG: diaminopimelate epimerase [Lachnoclostridium sp.]|jgi:diaminopimelate epimerase|nr:diaminopimelate epimerase [Lachnoclostridium sp.]
MKFTKMQGTGNDYVYVDLFTETIKNPGDVARFVSARHFGIGADGLVLIAPSETADCAMLMYNADGSESKMCGNAIRCVAKYAYEHGIVKQKELNIETKSGIKHIDLDVVAGSVQKIAVDMGPINLIPKEIPILAEGESFINQPIEVGDKTYTATCVSLGNPHCVIFTKNIDDLDLKSLGPLFEYHPMFPERINTEFATVLDEQNIKMRVWERGTGETESCGTGTCAVTAAAVLSGYCKRNEEIAVHIPGGVLYDTYYDSGRITMKGAAVEVYRGTIDLPF